MRTATLLMVSILCCAAVLAGATPAAAATINVPADYGTIQEAVTAAIAGDVIEVSGGPYSGKVSVSKAGLTLNGNGVTLNGGFYISAAGVTVDGFVVVGGTLIAPDYKGIGISSAGDNCTVKNCTIAGVFIGSQCYAIETGYNTDNLLIEGCQILASNAKGIYINPSTGVVLRGNYFEKGPGGDGWTNFLAEYNIFNGVNVGVSAVGPNVALHHNDFINNNAGRSVTWYGGQVIDATNNWWGSVNGPTDTVGTLEVPENPGASLADMLNAAPVGALGAGADDGGGNAPFGGSNVAYYPWLGAPANLNLAVADVSGGIGQSVNLEATLTDGGTPVAGKPISFWLDGSPVTGSPVNTDVNGVATLPYTVAVALGDHVIKAAFPGDATSMPAVGYGKLTVPQPSVVWVDDNYTAGGANDGHTWGYDAFAVIQQAVNAVADGGTVHVGPGNYPQQVALSRPVSLLGAQAGVTPVAGGRGGVGGESRIDATGWKYNAVNVTGDDVTVDGFMFDSCHEAITCTVNRALHQNVTISNNYFIGAGNAGVSLNPNSTMAGAFKNYTVSDNLFDLTGTAKGINLSANVALFVFDGLTVADNVIKCASGYGLFCGGFPRYEVNGLACTGNTFDQCRFNIVKMNNPTITGNIFKSIASGAAIYVGSHNGGSVNGNQIIDPVAGGDVSGIALCGGGYGYWDCAGLDVSGNTITGYATGLEVAAGFAGSAEGNTIAVTGNGIVVLAEDGNTTLPGSIADNTIAGSAGTDEVGILLAGITGAAAVDLGSTSFADDMDWFVRLAGQDGSEQSSVDVDATSATFQGAADDAAKEAKVWHDVDQAGMGHVDWGQGGATATNLSVQNVSGAKGATVELAARLTAGGSALAGQTVAISVDGAAVGLPVTDTNGWARVDYTITQDAGAFAIAAVFGGVFNYQAAAGTGTLTVTTPAPTSISVTMAPNPVTAGATSTATVTGSNGVDYSAAATCYIQYGAGGSWAGNVYTSAKAGTWTVTAVYGSLAATTTLTVDPGAASSVTLAPITASITTDQDQAYTVQVTDAQGNSWTPAVGDITWAENGAGAFNGMTYEPDAADGGSVVTITATVDGAASNAAALTVISSGSGGTPLILAWDKDTATFYLCSDAANPQAGTALALGNNTVGTVTVTVAKTGSSSTDLFATVTNAGVPTNSLRVRWYLRSGAVDKCYSYSTINGTTHTAVYSLGRTSVDGGRSQVGFFGLAHNLNADPPTAISYGVVRQP